MPQVRTRFAPSPTGYLHIGGLRTAAYAYALAKRQGGEFLLRIEDTDQKREVPGAKQKIFDLLKIFHLDWDQTPVTQSERAKSSAYRDAALKLISSGHAFYCQCVGRNAKTDGYSTLLRDPCRDLGLTSGAVKLRVPDGETISFTDFVLKKEISWDSSKVSDVVLLKSDGQLATYHLAQAVDDNFMQITHVIRGAEWLTSTPLHVLVHRYLNLPLPQIGHPSAILDPAGGKLSKRKNNVSVEQFLEAGYLPEALFNFIILLGWAPKDNRELFSLSEFVTAFDISGFQKSNPVYNLQKLDWFNGQYIRAKTDTELVQYVKPFVKDNILIEKFTQIVPLVRDRLVKLSDISSLTQFLVTPPTIPLETWVDPKVSYTHLQFALDHYTPLTPWTRENLDGDLVSKIKSRGWKVGDFFMTLRIAVCGSRFTPTLNEVMLILGKAEVVSRLKTSLSQLSTAI